MQAASGAANDAATACSNVVLAQSSVCDQLTKRTYPKLRTVQLRHSLLSIPIILRIQGLLDISCGRSGLSIAVGFEARQQHQLFGQMWRRWPGNTAGALATASSPLLLPTEPSTTFFGMLALFLCHQSRGTDCNNGPAGQLEGSLVKL